MPTETTIIARPDSESRAWPLDALSSNTPGVKESLPTYHATVIQSLDAFEALASEWRALLEACDEDNLSLDHPWLVTYLKHFPPSRLFVLTVRNQAGELVAAAPLKIAKNPTGVFGRLLNSLEFIGGNAPCVYDHIQFPIRPGEEVAAIVRLMAEQILKHRSFWDVLDLRFVNAGNILRLLKAYLQPQVFKQVLDEREAMFTLAFPESAGDGDACIWDKSLRKNLSRHRKRIHNDFGNHEITLEVQPPDEGSDQKLETFFDDLTGYWAGRGVRIDLMRYPQLRPFYKALHRLYPPNANGIARVELSYLKSGGTVFSCNLGFWRKGRFLGHLFTYQGEYRKYAPGLIHIQEIIRHVFRHGGRQLDFGRGDEAYKTQWANSQMPIYSLLTYKTPFAFFCLQADEQIKTAYRNFKNRKQQNAPADSES